MTARTVSPDRITVLKPGEDEQMARLEMLATLLDSQFRIPGTRFRFGVDALLGLLPGVGDTVSVALSSFLIREAHRMGAPMSLKLRMAWNVFLDWVTGLVPLVGDLFDIGFKANRRNLKLLQEHLRRR